MTLLTIENQTKSTQTIQISGQSDQFAQAIIERIGPLSSRNNFENSVELPVSIGAGIVRKIDLQKGLSIEIYDQYFHTDTSSNIHLCYSSLRFSFWLYGNSHYLALSSYGKKKVAVDQVMSGNCFVSYFPELKSCIRMKKETRIVHVIVNITPAIIKTILDDQFYELPSEIHAIAEGADNAGYYHSAPLSKSICSVLHEILSCPYVGGVRKMFLEGKALELVALKLAQIQFISVSTNLDTSSSGRDLDKIYLAESLLGRDLEHPPSLCDLARLVGLSPQKLNAGFRRVFGTTVFGHLQRIRLERARYLMEKQGKNVTEAALSVGYRSAPSFSQAFSKHFQILPKDCSRQH